MARNSCNLQRIADIDNHFQDRSAKDILGLGRLRRIRDRHWDDLENGPLLVSVLNALLTMSAVQLYEIGASMKPGKAWTLAWRASMQIAGNPSAVSA